jgi:hypothetical protein
MDIKLILKPLSMLLSVIIAPLIAAIQPIIGERPDFVMRYNFLYLPGN